MLERAIERFGGDALWTRVVCITLRLTSLRRDVFARVGRLVTPLPVLSATIQPIDVR